MSYLGVSNFSGLSILKLILIYTIAMTRQSRGKSFAKQKLVDEGNITIIDSTATSNALAVSIIK
jgi:hypothetical protein